MPQGTNIKTAIMGIAALVFALYRLGTPFLETTTEMEQEAEKIGREIDLVRQEGSLYSKAWEQKMAEQERKIAEILPDELDSSDVLNYFVTKFEEGSGGRARFLAVNQQSASVVEVKGGATGQKASKARGARYKIEAEIGQERVVPYLDHIERHPSLFRAEEFKFTVIRGDTLKLEMNLEFYLTPLDWVPPEKLVDMKPEEGDGDAKKSKPWKPVFINLNAGRRPAAAEAGPVAVPVISRIVGNSIVSNESLYEEGDTIGGWLLKKVDSQSRKVILKRGETVKEVHVK